MKYREPLSQTSIGISISDSQDMETIGLAEEHLRDAMTEVARHLLAMGARLVYGGDLRAHGFTDLLIELVARYKRDADLKDTRAAILNYLAWPALCCMDLEQINTHAQIVAGLVEMHCLDHQGRDIEPALLRKTPTSPPTSEEWSSGLMSMRHVMTKVCDARIILGGQVSGFKGRMPGIAEEALFCLQSEKPLYVLGGFGGCARGIAEELGLTSPQRAPATLWNDRTKFSGLTVDALNNGLSSVENQTLARTVHIDEAVALILRGMFRRFRPPN